MIDLKKRRSSRIEKNTTGPRLDYLQLSTLSVKFWHFGICSEIQITNKATSINLVKTFQPQTEKVSLFLGMASNPINLITDWIYERLSPDMCVVDRFYVLMVMFQNKNCLFHWCKQSNSRAGVKWDNCISKVGQTCIKKTMSPNLDYHTMTSLHNWV